MYFIKKQICKLSLNFSETFSSQAKFGGVFCVYTVDWMYNYEWLFFFFFFFFNPTLLSEMWFLSSFVFQVVKAMTVEIPLGNFIQNFRE